MNVARHQGAEPNTSCIQYAKSGTCRYGLDCKYSHDQPRSTSGSKSFNRSSKRPGKRPGKRRRSKAKAPELHGPYHIDKFFSEHPSFPYFDYDPSAPVWTEFNRMCQDFGWDRDSFEMQEEREEFKSAMVRQFNDLYGTDENDLSSWQALCHILRIVPAPTSVYMCRRRVGQTHVNLVDLVDTPRTGISVEVFPSLQELRDYTIKSKKYFPREDTHAGGLLRFLLRKIF